MLTASDGQWNIVQTQTADFIRKDYLSGWAFTASVVDPFAPLSVGQSPIGTSACDTFDTASWRRYVMRTDPPGSTPTEVLTANFAVDLSDYATV